jgi:hypothetical protein
MKDRTIFIILFLLFGYSAFQSARMYMREKKDKQRIEQSFKAAEETIRYYKTRNGQLVAQNNTLQLRYNEVKEIYPKIIDEIKNLDIKPKRVSQYAETVVRQEKEIVTRLRDSIIFDTIPARVFTYQDSFYTVKGIAIGDTQRVHITSTDSLIQVVYRGERIRPWLWFLSRRKTEQVISSKNPNSKIVYNKTIQIIKK